MYLHMVVAVQDKPELVPVDMLVLLLLGSHRVVGDHILLLVVVPHLWDNLQPRQDNLLLGDRLAVLGIQGPHVVQAFHVVLHVACHVVLHQGTSPEILRSKLSENS